MSKRPITFNKPEDPSFLKQIKASIGYKEGPNVDTKRQKLEDCSSDDEERDTELDYKPQVVVLRAGDLTEEEAEREKQRLLRDELEKPADLTQRVVFKKPIKVAAKEDDATKSTDTRNPSSKLPRKQGSTSTSEKSSKKSAKLSFAQDDEEEEEF